MKIARPSAHLSRPDLAVAFEGLGPSYLPGHRHVEKRVDDTKGPDRTPGPGVGAIGPDGPELAAPADHTGRMPSTTVRQSLPSAGQMAMVGTCLAEIVVVGCPKCVACQRSPETAEMWTDPSADFDLS